MKNIEVISKYGTFEIKMDDEDYPIFEEYNWHVTGGAKRSNGKISLYLVSTNRVLREKHGVSSVYFHKLIKGDFSKTYDFVDGNTFNLQKLNIRICTDQEDSRNFKMQIRDNKSSKYKGVAYSKEKNKYKVNIKIEKGIETHIGYFESEVEAALNYNYFANLHFKEFARLNIIPEFEIQPLLDEKNRIISDLKLKLSTIRNIINTSID